MPLPRPLPRKTKSSKSPGGALTLPGALAALPAPLATREKILFAAVTVLNEEGFTALTQQRVCECAAIRQSHLTYYFPTRNDLLREAAAYGCEAMLGAITQGIDAGLVTLTNMREKLSADITDRRWARLINALIAASDEDVRIKPWLAAFDAKARERLLADFRRLRLDATEGDVELLYATFMGAIQQDLGESTDASLGRAQRVIGLALDRLLAGPRIPLPGRKRTVPAVQIEQSAQKAGIAARRKVLGRRGQ